MVEREGRYVIAVLEEAVNRSGLWDWGDMAFTEQLRLFTESARRSGALNAVGRDVLHKVVIRHLRNRLSLEAFVKAHPEVRVAPVRHPVFITGLPRTGTTLLHNLMACDPTNRVLRFWEALRPFPRDPGADGRSEETLVAEAEVWLERLYALAPYFRAIHASTATGPEECDVLFQNAFASQHFDDMFRADDYSAWLAETPLTAEYAYYRRQLQVLQLQALQLHAGEGGDRQWVLKSPSHLGYLAALFETFPDATVVVCHRDPDEAVASYASLVMNVRQPYSDDVQPDVVGAHALRRCGVAMGRALAARDAVGDDRFVDISYGSLVSDPVEVIRGLYQRLERPLTETDDAAMVAWLAENPHHRHGAHRYGLHQYGLTSAAVAEALSPYHERFGAQLASR
ncbi:MAG: sulfotransferase [Actinomycetota bacterium]|nr:sulfotransferase [Actinomycetota bacterium]